jgi:hypothetical protein
VQLQTVAGINPAKPHIVIVHPRGVPSPPGNRFFGVRAKTSRSNRKKKIRHGTEPYKKRNVVERCFCRLKDFRRIATRYDKLARSFLSALCLVATF